MQDRCPFCNNITNLQNASFSDNFHADGIENPNIATPDGHVEFPNTTNLDSFYRCDTCPIDYTDELTDIDKIVKFLHGNRNIAMLLNHYYNDIPIKELFTKQNVRLFRKSPNAYSFISKAKSKKQIYFVLTYNNKKTSGIILKMGKKLYKLSDLEEI